MNLPVSIIDENNIFILDREMKSEYFRIYWAIFMINRRIFLVQI